MHKNVRLPIAYHVIGHPDIWGVQRQTFLASLAGALGRGQKVKYHLISITSQFQRFIPNCGCVLTNERYNTYQMGFLFCRLGNAKGVGLCGTGGARRVKHFFPTWSCSISNRWDDEQNKMQVTFSSYGQTGDLGARSNIINMPISNIYTLNFVCVLTKIR